MLKTEIFGIEIKNITKTWLNSKIKNLKEGDKQTLYFLYSEFLLRANRNPAYKQTLKDGDILAVDGKGVLWAQKTLNIKGLLPTIYQRGLSLNLPKILRQLIFLVLVGLELIKNFFSGVLGALLFKGSWYRGSGNELILGRDYIYDLFEIANDSKWKIQLVSGGTEQTSKTVIQKLKNKYPEIHFLHTFFNPDSNLMRDIPLNTKEKLTTDNLLEFFPDLKPAIQNCQENQPDIIIVALGGASGKQEFLIDYLKNEISCRFRLCTGVGAALDHLGGGKTQNPAPSWMQYIGLEWVHRFIQQPYRRKRILDSIFSFYFWVTVEEFTQLEKDNLA